MARSAIPLYGKVPQGMKLQRVFESRATSPHVLSYLFRLTEAWFYFSHNPNRNLLEVKTDVDIKIKRVFKM
jgi:hypothetical protein